MAFIVGAGPEDKEDAGAQRRSIPGTARPIMGNSGAFQVLKYDSNSVRVKTKFDSRKFLVYNDSFHSEWQAFVDGKKTDLFRANVAFKGVWIPAGEHTVYFRYGANWRYGLELLLLGTFHIIFVYLVWGTWKERNESE